MRAAALIAFYLAVVLSPLVIASLSGFPPRTFWDELGSAAGMLAFSVLLVEFVLSGRFRHISGRVGMDIAMRAHQLLARTCVALALLHPFLYLSPRAPDLVWDVTRQSTIAWEFDVLWSGIAAFLLLPTFVLLAIARRETDYRYQVWRFIHGITALMIAGAVLHHALHAGRYTIDDRMVLYWWVLFTAALSTLVLVYIIRPILRSARPWRVATVEKVADRTWQLDLEAEGHPGLTYRAGQFAWITVGRTAFSLADNPFSIASAPGDAGTLRFVIKELGDFTSTLGDIPLGTRAYVDGPYGNLCLPGPEIPGVALIAGGVGIAPMLGLLRDRELRGDTRPAVVVYGNRAANQIVQSEVLDRAEIDPGTEVVYILSEPPAEWAGPRGNISAEFLRELFRAPGYRNWSFVLCGPAVMLDIVEATLHDIGVPQHQIHSERFDYD